MKHLPSLALFVSLSCNAMASDQGTAPVADFSSKAAVQQALNEYWPEPLLNAFSAYRCGYDNIGKRTIAGMLEKTPETVNGSPIAYGFLLGYSDHLGSLKIDENSSSVGCKAIASRNPDALKTLPDDRIDSNRAIDQMIKDTGIIDSLGQSRINNLLISTSNIQSRLGVKLNASVLLSACNDPEASKLMPTAIDVINGSGLVGTPDKQKIKDALDVWFGYSQGIYWHAISLVNQYEPKQKTEFCHNLKMNAQDL
ncbi:hypothetical protein ACI2KR_08380 [Pseudomonas luteola]